MPGPRPQPTHLKLLKGRHKKESLNLDEPTSSHDLPIAPDYLSSRAKAIFETLVTRIDEMGYASASHTEALALCAMRLEEVEIYSRCIEAQGATYLTTSTQGDQVIKSNPAVAQRSEAMRHAQSLLAEFGLTPSSATKVVVPGKQKKNPFSAL